MSDTIVLTEIKVQQKTKKVLLQFENPFETYEVPCYYLRLHSPAADNNYESDSIIDKAINIIAIEPVGNYAVKLLFDDGHETGIYTWEKLYELGKMYQKSL